MYALLLLNKISSELLWFSPPGKIIRRTFSDYTVISTRVLQNHHFKLVMKDGIRKSDENCLYIHVG